MTIASILPAEAELIVKDLDQIFQQIYGRAGIKRCYCNNFKHVWVLLLEFSHGYLIPYLIKRPFLKNTFRKLL